MRRLGVLICLTVIVFLTFISIVYAAKIEGAVYDLSLKRQTSVIVEINTSTKQLFVVQNGTYYFDVPNGFYTIKVKSVEKNEMITQLTENLTVAQEGAYTLDLILYPDLGEIEKAVNEIDIGNSSIKNNEAKNKKDYSFTITLVVMLSLSLIIAIGMYYIRKSIKQTANKHETSNEDEYLNQVLKIVSQEGGRTTQKDIRKQIPLSEAKISLMIAELEHKGVIEKIKKGRGNIIILKKK